MPADGKYDLIDIKDEFVDEFLSEKDMCDYIELNIAAFTKETLGLEYKSHKREYPLVYNHGKNVSGNRKLDFLIITKCGKKIAIECKKPKYVSELTSAIGQCLAYSALFEYNDKPIDSIHIVSSKIDFVVPLVLSKYNLPIGYICLDKTKIAVMQ